MKQQAVNAGGVFLGMKYAIAQMMKQDALPSGERGWVVNIASVGGQVGIPLERKTLSLLNAIRP
jgi:NAD(P)-dependent dehydrogenase (short-subunit alcohol dehydrogenase family)